MTGLPCLRSIPACIRRFTAFLLNRDAKLGDCAPLALWTTSVSMGGGP